jgi:hypothetical protein
MDTLHLYYALALMQQREAEERARTDRIAKQLRAARRTAVSAPQWGQRRLARRPRPVGEAA